MTFHTSCLPILHNIVIRKSARQDRWLLSCSRIEEDIDYSCPVFDTNKFVCPIMDARRNQVYTGVYCYTDHRLDTVWEQDTMSIEALAEGLNCLDHEVIFLGDGVAVYREKLQELLTIPFSFAPAHVNRQIAAAVGALAEVYYKEGKIQTAEEHEPEYLRKSQAERERAERESVKHADVVKKQENGEKSE